LSYVILFVTQLSRCSEAVYDALSVAQASISKIHSATFVKAARDNLHSSHRSHCNSKLESLTVQNEFLDIGNLLGTSLSFVEEADVSVVSVNPADFQSCSN